MGLLLGITFFFACLLCPTACARGVQDGLQLAASRALPALFPFFVASGLLTRTGAADRLSHRLARPMERLFGLPAAACPALVLGLTGGYPVGAQTCAALVQSHALAPEQAARANAFCNCASPGFCIALVGVQVCGSARTGAVLYLTTLVSALLVGLLLRPRRRAAPSPAALSCPTPEHFAAALCQSTGQAAMIALTVTAFLVLFSVILSLLAPVFARFPALQALTGLLELTCGLCVLPALVPSRPLLVLLCAFLLGFGGLAVHLQVITLTAPAQIDSGRFFVAKLLHGGLSVLLTLPFVRFL